MNLLPQSPENERAILSAWMTHPDTVPGICAMHGMTETWFMQPFCGALYRVLQGMWMDGTPCVHAAIVERLRKNSDWQPETPQMMHAVRTTHSIPSAVPMFLETLKDKAVLRALINTCQQIEAQAWEATESSELIVQAMKEVNETANLGAVNTVRALAQHAKDYYNTLVEADCASNVLKTGIAKLDSYSPVIKGDMPAISGERKAGKSILSITIALRLAETVPVLYFSLEDKTAKLIKRIVANVSKVPVLSHRNPNGGQEMMMGAAMTRMQNMNLILHDDIQDLAGIVGRVRQFKAQNQDLSAVFVDYLQLIKGARAKGDTREMEVANISRTLRLLAMETDAAIFVLSQLNQDGAARESRAIEMDVTAMWKISLVENEPGVRMLEIPFQRDGDSGVGFKVAFLGERATVEDLYEGAR